MYINNLLKKLLQKIINLVGVIHEYLNDTR